MGPEETVKEEVDDRLGMTAEQWERFQAYLRLHGHGEQDENGVDLSLLRANLKLTPTERVEKMRRALALQLEVRRAGEIAGLSPNSRRT
jgi:hypothetical protein